MFDTLYNRGNILVKIRPCGDDLVSLQTYDRQMGRSSRFIIVKKTLADHDFSQGAFYDGDCGNILKIWFAPHSFRLCFEVVWLHDLGSGKVCGYRQMFSFNPGLGVLENMVEGQGGSYLYKNIRPEYTIRFEKHAMENIRELAKNKHARRAFCKAMRTAFQWPETGTKVYADGRNNFFFQTNDGLCGGLIRHEYGGRIAYSVHT